MTAVAARTRADAVRNRERVIAAAAEQERDPAVWRHYARLVIDALRA